jgi:hypothetical protein
LRLEFIAEVACEDSVRGKIGTARDGRLNWVAEGPSDAGMKISCN